MDIKEYEELFGKCEYINNDCLDNGYNFTKSYATREECEFLKEKEKELKIDKRIKFLKDPLRYIFGNTVRAASWVIDLNQFKKEIREYVYKYDRLPYLFMNRDTIEMFWEDIKADKEKYPEEATLVDINPSYISGNLDIDDLMYHYGYCDDWEDDDIPENKDEEIYKLKKEYYGTAGRYNGCRVYLNDRLDYGEIEIR